MSPELSFYVDTAHLMTPQFWGQLSRSISSQAFSTVALEHHLQYQLLIRDYFPRSTDLGRVAFQDPSFGKSVGPKGHPDATQLGCSSLFVVWFVSLLVLVTVEHQALETSVQDRC